MILKTRKKKPETYAERKGLTENIEFSKQVELNEPESNPSHAR